MTVRTRLMILTVLGLVLTMAVWGWVQIRALDQILVEQQGRRLSNVAETVSTYYAHFPTRQGLSTLDTTLKEQIQTDVRLARIDIFTVVNYDIDYIEYIAGSSRVRYEWPESLVSSVAASRKPQYVRLKMDEGPAVGLLYPVTSEKSQNTQYVVGVIIFSRANAEILARAQRLLVISTVGLLAIILLVLAASYRWLIGRPLNVIIHAIDAFQTGQYVKRIPIRRRDEWGLLGEHFNSMADEIEQVLKRNQELNRSLEDRVREATQKVVELQKQVSQLQQLTAMGYLTATIAHDLGTPLHSIAGLASLLQERGSWPPDVARKLDLIVQQTQRLNTVIQNVRRATRPPEAHFETVVVRDLLNETLSLVEPLMSKAGTELVVDFDENLPGIPADRYRVQTALFNLIQNALEATPSGGRLTVSTGMAMDGREVTITVADTGSGIPPELMERICEPFFSTHQEEGMRGLGLAIVQDIVKMHGGRMEIKSVPGAGTQIVLGFPVGGNAGEAK
ncbi:MAG: HAMP domain-containing protein [Deltaproteobacteria bacterium]|nr:HAMP domain-containing protein [Deltaproteobacteria bacterium]